jgi:hypothetical protein
MKMGRAMGKSSTLTAADVDNIIRGNFAPDIGKLAAAIETNVGDAAALRAIGARIVANYGQEGLRKVMHLINTAHAEEFSNPEAFDLVIGGLQKYLNFRPMTTKGEIAKQPYYEIYRGSSSKRKKTTKAEAIARHIDALVKLLQIEPNTIVGPILDSLIERINRGAARSLSCLKEDHGQQPKR